MAVSRSGGDSRGHGNRSRRSQRLADGRYQMAENHAGQRMRSGGRRRSRRFRRGIAGRWRRFGGGVPSTRFRNQQPIREFGASERRSFSKPGLSTATQGQWFRWVGKKLGMILWSLPVRPLLVAHAHRARIWHVKYLCVRAAQLCHCKNSQGFPVARNRLD